MSVFGFSTEPSNGADFTPIVKYDARAGRVFRVDRVQGADGFDNEQIDITPIFKAVFDFENVEVGWARFTPNAAPSFALVPMGQDMPPAPTKEHKNAIRLLLKLHPSCGGDKPVREMALQAKSSLSGIEKVYQEYQAEKAKNPGKLPVIVLTSTKPITTGSGSTKSTNYQPVFTITGWSKRPDDLIYIPAEQAHTNGSGQPQEGAPSTGHQTVPPPNKLGPQPADDNDFG